MRDIVTKSKRDFADEIERERSNAKQLKESLKNLQVFISINYELHHCVACVLFFIAY